MPDLEAIARAVDPRAVKSGNSFRFRCPCHDDASPSASMTFEGERLLVHCHAGCSNSDLFSAVRAKAGHLMPGPAGRGQPGANTGAVGRSPPGRAMQASGGAQTPAVAPSGANTPDFQALAPAGMRPAGHWVYRLADGGAVGIVARWDGPEGKTIRPFVWRGSGWAMGAMPEPRPLYALPEVAAGGSQVLVVEGEKAAEAAGRALPLPVVTWAGGAQAAGKADWGPLRGRKAILWPDNDAPGFKAMREVADILAGLGCAVRFVVPDEREEKGWDAADALARGDDLAGYIRAHLAESLPHRHNGQAGAPIIAPVQSEPELVAPEVVEAMQEAEAEIAPPSIAAGSLPITMNSSGTLAERTETNAELLIGLFVQAGAVSMWCDALSGAQMIQWGNERARYVNWESDSVELALRIQRLDSPYRKIDSIIVERVMRAMFQRIIRDPVREWFESLPAWDGVDRFVDLVDKGLGITSHRDFAIQALRNHFVATVVRQFEPGAKYDHALILEGVQGIGKSSVIRMLAPAGSFNTLSHTQFGTRDFYDLLHRHVFLELAELATISRSQLEAVKADIANACDVYRPAWGRSVISRERRCIFWGSTNLGEYLHDTTGARRFWPITVGRIDFRWVIANRDQLWAQAVTLRDSGEDYWNIPAGLAVSEQEQRRVEHPWEAELKRRIAFHPPSNPGGSWLERSGPLCRLTVPEAFDLMDIQVQRRGRAEQMMMSAAFVSIGWQRRRTGTFRFYVGPGDPLFVPE